MSRVDCRPELRVEWLVAGERRVQFAFLALTDVFQRSDGVLLEVRRVAMRREGVFVAILLVKEEALRIRLVAMDDVHQAARLLPRSSLKLGENLRYLVLMSTFRYPSHCQYDHTVLRLLVSCSAQCIERLRELRDKHRLLTVGTSGNDSDFRARLLLNEIQITPGLFRQPL